MSDNPLLCELCGNTGRVTIWHPLIVRSVREGRDTFGASTVEYRTRNPDGKLKHWTAAIACACKRGGWFVTDRRPERFRPGHHVPVQHVAFPDPEQQIAESQ